MQEFRINTMTHERYEEIKNTLADNELNIVRDSVNEKRTTIPTINLLEANYAKNNI